MLGLFVLFKFYFNMCKITEANSLLPNNKSEFELQSSICDITREWEYSILDFWDCKLQ